jgi:transposase
MIALSDPIFVYTVPIDMRKSINGLSILVQLAGDACESNKEVAGTATKPGSAFVFLNKSRNKIKILVKENNGFVLLYKRLDRGCFNYSFSPKAPLSLTQQQLRWLLEGLDYAKLTPSKSTTFTHHF